MENTQKTQAANTETEIKIETNRRGDAKGERDRVSEKQRERESEREEGRKS